ncbi:MAG: hypothetical protein WD578_06670 [Bacteroidales bacterium]
MNALKIFIDIGHPAYYLFFRNVIKILLEEGHKVYVSVRDKDVTLQFLVNDLPGPAAGESMNEPVLFYRGKGGKGWITKAFYLLYTVARVTLINRKNGTNVLVSFSSPYAAMAGWLLRKPVLTFEDTEHSMLLHRINMKFSLKMITGTSYCGSFGDKQIRIPFYKERCYLGPELFRPDPSIPAQYGYSVDKPYAILRLVGNQTIHEKKRKGLTEYYLQEIIRRLSPAVRILISSEKQLPPSLQQYEIAVAGQAGKTKAAIMLKTPNHLHHFLAYASLLNGESSTMAAEAAVLGVPAIYIDNHPRGYCQELEERFGLMFNFSESEKSREQALLTAVKLIEDKRTRKTWQEKREVMLKAKLGGSVWIVDEIKRYCQNQSVHASQMHN